MQRERQFFSLVEILVVMTIILILLGIYLSGFDRIPIGVAATKADIIKLEMAMMEYRSRYGSYPFDTRSEAVNLSDHTDEEVKEVVVELLKLETFDINNQGVPIGYWENPIYYIAKRNYSSSPLAGSIPNLSEKVFYNPNTFQLVSGGPDGTPTSLGVAEDNVANYPKR